ncbi:SDR family oxidoreductase [Gloeobacter violaceus]|uniref:Gll2833 protein n=1 Tax=Gloeobacter violaceus (strain ATCC 29082 / PCC 7421) TaxID=251221 RepID=Q7NCZ3_GLOVI|nr:SDR family oxidoreductase [Gloeobacter violaceus]BAC90774.1 gll2833 [Gloeobacter violaceus PCC 7421]
MAQFKGKRAWITGASSGIGAATALTLAERRAEVVLSARRLDRLESLAAKIRQTGGKAMVRELNVADRAAVQTLGRELEASGGVDILVNNAGLMPLSPLLKGRVDEWDAIVDINIKGLLYVTHAVLPGMIARRHGHIVNIGSVAGQLTFPGGAVYCDSKFAVRAISDALRKEVLSYDIRVTDIQSGAVDTELIDSVKDPEIKQAPTSEGSFFGPDARMLQAQDIANAILYALSQPLRMNVCELLVRPLSQEF